MRIQEIVEGTRCWKGYKKKGTKKMFGKTVPNCVKNEAIGEIDQYEISYKNSKGQIAPFQSGLTKQQADDKIYKLINGIRQWGNDPSKLNFDNEKMDPQNIILKKNGQQIPLPYGNVQEVNTGNPNKGKYVIKTDEPGRKSPDIVILPDEKAANDMVASLSKKKTNNNYWVELVETDIDFDPTDNPTDEYLELQQAEADDIVLTNKELAHLSKQQKVYKYPEIKKNFYRKHGPEKAERMLAAMTQKGLFN